MSELSVAIGGGPTAIGRFGLSQSVLDHAPIGMAITTPDDRVIWVNAALEDVLGIPSADITHQDLLSFVHPDDRALLTEDTVVLLSGRAIPEAREFRWQEVDGTSRWASGRTSIAVAESGQPLLYGDPALPCIIRQLLDVTEKKSAEAELARALGQLQERNVELERSNEELTQFAYVASHDLSEPLRVIAGHVDLLARRYSGQLDDDADRYIAFAVDGCTRLRTLIEDLLSFSRAGRDLTLTPVDCAAVVEQVRRNLEGSLQETGGSITVDGELPTVQADLTQLSQVFANLAANAIKYGRPEVAPSVHISAHREPGGWRFDVADNGIGIAEHHRQRIFRIFQRLHGREIPGTGIGLAICRKVIERHRGSIEVSDSPYGGTTFSFVLPDCGTLRV